MSAQRPILLTDKVAAELARVAEGPNTPEQLGMDELRPEIAHARARGWPTRFGFRVACTCGWLSAECPERSSAEHQWRQHWGRTPAGARIVRALRQRRRFGHQ